MIKKLTFILICFFSLNFTSFAEDKNPASELFQRLNDLRLKEQKIQKIITYSFLSALVVVFCLL